MATQCGHTDYDSEIIDDCKVCMRARIAELEGALRKYGRHQKGPDHLCNFLRHSDFKCDCGFDELQLPE